MLLEHVLLAIALMLSVCGAAWGATFDRTWMVIGFLPGLCATLGLMQIYTRSTVRQ